MIVVVVEIAKGSDIVSQASMTILINEKELGSLNIRSRAAHINSGLSRVFLEDYAAVSTRCSTYISLKHRMAALDIPNSDEGTACFQNTTSIGAIK